MPNLYEPDFDAGQEQPGFTWRRARLGRQAGADRLGASLFELQPGDAAFPYHFHFGNEEMLVVVSGRPSLRTGQEWRKLDEGEVVAFRVGEEGGHQVANLSDAPARILMLSEMNGPDVIVLPDSGKVQAREGAPGGPDPGLWQIFRSEDAVAYFEGEEPPRAD